MIAAMMAIRVAVALVAVVLAVVLSAAWAAPSNATVGLRAKLPQADGVVQLDSIGSPGFRSV